MRLYLETAERAEELGNFKHTFCKCEQCLASKNKRHKPRRFFKRLMSKRARNIFGKRDHFYYA